MTLAPRTPRTPRSPGAALVLGVLGVFGVSLALSCRSSRRAPPGPLASAAAPLAPVAPARPKPSASAPLARLSAPRAAAAPRCDGESDEAAWSGAAHTGPFLDSSGAPARPYSEARLVWHDHSLYALLYAADEDIRKPAGAHDSALWTGDAFRLTVRPHGNGGEAFHVDVAPNGVVTDAREVPGGALDTSFESGARAGVDLDGTPDDPSDDDEEWVVELSLPLDKVGVEPREGASFELALSRCDTPKGGPRRCGAWSGVVTLGAALTPPASR